MTSKWFLAVGLLLVVIVVLALVARKSVRAELMINAEPEQVWSVLTDAGSYEDWNPILVSVDGDFVEGQTLSVGMKNPGWQHHGGRAEDPETGVRRGVEPGRRYTGHTDFRSHLDS